MLHSRGACTFYLSLLLLFQSTCSFLFCLSCCILSFLSFFLSFILVLSVQHKCLYMNILVLFSLNLTIVTISLTKTAYFFPDKSEYAVARGCMRMYSFKKYSFFDIIGPGMTDLCSFHFSDNNFFLFCLLSEAVSDLSTLMTLGDFNLFKS